MLPRRLPVLCAGLGLAAGLGGCASTRPMVLGGQVVPPGTPVAIRGQLYPGEHDDAWRMLHRRGFAPVDDDAPAPRYVFFVEMPLTLRPGTPSYCQMELLRDGQPVEKAVSPFVEGQLLRPSVAPAWHTAAFRQTLDQFSEALRHAR